MPVFALNKYRSLDTLLQRLAASLRHGHLAIADRWRDDERALGLYKPGEPQLAAYVFTHGQPPGYYGVHLEYPDLIDNDVGNVPVVCEDIRLDRLLDLLALHFGLHEIDF